MRETLLYSLLELAHATSQNLGFSHRGDVHVSYGEETITETNLLELRRRHPMVVRLKTFGKKKESLNGADWEWHIIGRAREFRMRVQAKRLQRNDKLIIPHKVASSGTQQIDLLIADAKVWGLKPVYCLYASEAQRTIWQKGSSQNGLEEFEYGCLLVSARSVKAKMPKTLTAIEEDCIPWHYLAEQRRYSQKKLFDVFGNKSTLSFVSFDGTLPAPPAFGESKVSFDEFPTFDELNDVDGGEIQREGVVEAGLPERHMSEEAYLERGISRLIEIDVRELPPRR